MKPNQKNRYNGRHTNRSNRTIIMRNTVLESSGPAGKLHGTALQLSEKYQAAAKDALIQNDLIMAQTYLQYADHYIRLQNIAIQNEQNFRNQNANRAVEVCVTEKNDELPLIELPTEQPETTVLSEQPSDETVVESLNTVNSMSESASTNSPSSDEIMPETISISVTPKQPTKEKKVIRRPRVAKTKQLSETPSEVAVS